MRRSKRPLLGAVLLLTGLVPSLAQAQTVTGNVVAEDSGRPLTAVVVALVDEAGQVRVRVLTDGEGTFRLRVPGPGRYSLRAERLGYSALEVEPFEVGADSEIVRGFTLASEPIALEGLEVTGESRCRLRPDEGEELARVWQRVRVALQVEALVREQEALRFHVRHFNRELSADGSRTRDEQEAFERGVARSTFRSAPIGELVSDGWIQVDPADGAWDYYAPDADALLSPAFEEGHCFRLVRDDEARPGLVGLAFEEVGARSVPGIEGALWVDESAGALRFLTYRYTRLPPLPSSPRVPRLSEEALGGRVEFVELPGGSWIVSRWSIRAPMLRSEDPTRRGLGFQDEVVLEGVWEMGSEVIEAQVPGGELLVLAPGVAAPQPSEAPAPPAESPALAGVLTESGGAPLAGATVLLQHGQLTTTTDQEGRFEFDRLPPNTYHLAFEHPSLVELEAYTGQPVAVEAEVAEGVGTLLELVVPSVASILMEECAEAGHHEGRVVAGTVRTEAGGVVLPGAEVTLSWAGDGPEEQRVVEADADGRFLFCGLPADGTVSLTSALLGVVGEPVTAELAGTGVIVRELILVPPGSPER